MDVNCHILVIKECTFSLSCCSAFIVIYDCKNQDGDLQKPRWTWSFKTVVFKPMGDVMMTVCTSKRQSQYRRRGLAHGALVCLQLQRNTAIQGLWWDIKTQWFNSIYFICIARHHTFSFTICTAYTILCPRTLDSEQENLPQNLLRESNRRGIPLPGRSEVQSMSEWTT